MKKQHAILNLLYDMGMPIKGQRSTTDEDGKEVYTVAFTNGALEELEQLQQNFHLTNLEEVLRVAIALMRRVDEINNASEKKANR